MHCSPSPAQSNVPIGHFRVPFSFESVLPCVASRSASLADLTDRVNMLITSSVLSFGCCFCSCCTEDLSSLLFTSSSEVWLIVSSSINSHFAPSMALLRMASSSFIRGSGCCWGFVTKSTATGSCDCCCSPLFGDSVFSFLPASQYCVIFGEELTMRNR